MVSVTQPLTGTGLASLGLHPTPRAHRTPAVAPSATALTLRDTDLPGDWDGRAIVIDVHHHHGQRGRAHERWCSSVHRCHHQAVDRHEDQVCVHTYEGAPYTCTAPGTCTAHLHHTWDMNCRCAQAGACACGGQTVQQLRVWADGPVQRILCRCLRNVLGALVDKMVISPRLDSVISDVFSNLHDCMIWRARVGQWVWYTESMLGQASEFLHT